MPWDTDRGGAPPALAPGDPQSTTLDSRPSPGLSGADRNRSCHESDGDTDRQACETDPVGPGPVTGAVYHIDDLVGVSDGSEIEDPA